MSNVTIGFVGAGNMGEALIKGALTYIPAQNIGFMESSQERKTYISQTYKINCLASYEQLNAYDICILAIKPQTVPEIVETLSKSLSAKTLIVSIIAGISIDYFKKYFPESKIIRVMPNTPCLINEGMSGLSFSSNCKASDKKVVSNLFKQVGEVLTVKEQLINSVTALSGSGPAYFYYIADVFAQEAHALGVNYQEALKLVCQTMLGSAKMLLSTDKTPQELIKMVTSKGGTTEAALKVLKSSSVSDIISDTILAAKKRAEELGGKK